MRALIGLGLVTSLVVTVGCSGESGASASAASSSSGGTAHSGDPDAGEPVVELPALPALQHTTVLPDLNEDAAIVEVALTAEQTSHTYRGSAPTQVWAYNGMVPGPTIQARVGDRVIVHFVNNLPEATTVHWHGLRITPEMDGDVHHVPAVEPGAMFTYDFIVPDAGSFWFHPHYNTPEQIERGLMGTLLVHEATPPIFDAERILFTDDVKLTSGNTIAPFLTSGPDRMHGRGGNVLLLNGRETNDAITVQAGTRERWRLFNGANGRTMELSITGASFKIVGTDGGPLPSGYTASRITLAIGQRFDLDVTFDGAPGSAAQLTSHILMLDANEDVVEVPVIIQEFVYDTAGARPVIDVTVSGPDLPAVDYSAVAQKTLALNGINDNGTVRFSINEYISPNEEHWQVPMGDMTVEIVNQLPMEHPFHIHGQFFQVLRRGTSVADEPGLKDTVLVGGMQRVVVTIHFNNPGSWMYHCHIPEHSEVGMMGHVHVMADGD